MATSTKASSDLGSYLSALIRGLAPGRSEEAGAAWERVVEATERVRKDAAEILSGEVSERNTRATQAHEALQRRHRRIEAYAQRVRHAVPAIKGQYILAGCVQEHAARLGLPNLVVRASLDGGSREEPSTSRTDALGYFRFQWAAETLRARAEGKEVRMTLEVLANDEESVLHRTQHVFSLEEKNGWFVCLAVEGDRAAEPVETARAVDEAVKARLNDLRAAASVLTTAPARDTLRRAASSVLRIDIPVSSGDEPGPVDQRTVEEVSGVGQKFSEMLRKQGIRTAAALAALEPKKLASLLGIAETRAKSILEQARASAKKD